MTDELPEADPLVLILAGVAQLQESNRRWKFLGLALVVALFIATSGWWLTSRDHSATERNGRVADCRQTELATLLDDFSFVVSPQATDQQKADAADRIAKRVLDDRTLVVSFAICTGRGITVCNDNSVTQSTGRGTCSSHGGVKSTVQPR